VVWFLVSRLLKISLSTYCHVKTLSKESGRAMAAVQETKELKHKRMELEHERMELKQERMELNQQVKQKGIDKEEKHDINQRIIAIDNQITSLNKQQTAIMSAAEYHWSHHPLLQFVGFTGFCSIGAAWRYLLPNYTMWRHRIAPYSAGQLQFRRDWLGIDLQHPKDPRWARRIFVSCIPLSLLERWWKSKTPPPPPM
jgi:hypothetical protein